MLVYWQEGRLKQNVLEKAAAWDGECTIINWQQDSAWQQKHQSAHSAVHTSHGEVIHDGWQTANLT